MLDVDHRFFLQHDFGIINPLQVEENLWADLPATPLVPSELADQASFMPLLIDLKSLSLDARINLMGRAAEHESNSIYPYFSALLQTDCDTAQLARQLAQRLILRGPDKKVWLRYFDPRVFCHLLWLFNAEQLWFLLRDIQQWSWRDPQESWHTYSVVKTDISISLLRLTPEQWQHLEKLGLLNHCLKMLLAAGHEYQLDKNTLLQLRKGLDEAKNQHGLISDTDRSVFAIQQWRFGNQLHAHPHMQALLGEALKNKASYEGLCRTISEETLHEFANAMQQYQHKE